MAVEGETDAAGRLAGTLAVGLKNFTEGGAGLDFEINLIVVLEEFSMIIMNSVDVYSALNLNIDGVLLLLWWRHGWVHFKSSGVEVILGPF